MYNQVKSCTKHGRPDQSQRKLTVALMVWTTKTLVCDVIHILNADSRAEGAEAPPLICSNNVSNNRSERNVKKQRSKSECEEKEDQ